MEPKDTVITEGTEDHCAGWKSPDECPHDGIFDSNSKACKECEEDAMKALNEAYKDIQ